MILGADGEKMSKSRGNVVNPDEIVDELGADAFRMYEMFMGAFDQAIPWSTDGARGCRRFLDRVWRLQEMLTDDEGDVRRHGATTCIRLHQEGLRGLRAHEVQHRHRGHDDAGERSSTPRAASPGAS